MSDGTTTGGVPQPGPTGGGAVIPQATTTTTTITNANNNDAAGSPPSLQRSKPAPMEAHSNMEETSVDAIGEHDATPTRKAIAVVKKRPMDNICNSKVKTVDIYSAAVVHEHHADPSANCGASDTLNSSYDNNNSNSNPGVGDNELPPSTPPSDPSTDSRPLSWSPATPTDTRSLEDVANASSTASDHPSINSNPLYFDSDDECGRDDDNEDIEAVPHVPVPVRTSATRGVVVDVDGNNNNNNNNCQFSIAEMDCNESDPIPLVARRDQKDNNDNSNSTTSSTSSSSSPSYTQSCSSVDEPLLAPRVLRPPGSRLAGGAACSPTDAPSSATVRLGAAVPFPVRGGTGIGSSTTSGGLPVVALSIFEVPGVMELVAPFVGFHALCQLMLVSRSMRKVTCSDTVWKIILDSFNLKPLLTTHAISREYYRFYLENIITTKALHGRYTYLAAAAVSANSSTTMRGSAFSHLTNNAINNNAQDTYSFAEVTLLVSSASLGQMYHPIGRVQLFCRYEDGTMEVLQGSCRFSPYRRCFSFCCNPFASAVRGPVFSVVTRIVSKQWKNESSQHYYKHQGGLRLIMTPALLEGPGSGSQITEKDIIAVSKPRER